MRKDRPLMPRGQLAYAGKLLALASAYVALGKLGLAMTPVSGFATLVWPPTGLALAALVLGGYRLWPAIAVGALVTNLWTGAPSLVAAGIAAGNTLEAVVATYSLRQIPGFRSSLDRFTDVASLAVLAGMSSTVISATLGTASLLWGGVVSTSGFGRTWLAWWTGDLMGVLVVAPVLLTWRSGPRAPVRRAALAEAAALAVSLIACAALVFSQRPETVAELPILLPYVLFLPLIWAALRFGTRGAALGVLVVAFVAVLGTYTGHGAFAQTNSVENLTALHVFLASASVASLSLGAIVSERERSQGALRDRESVLRAILDGTIDAVYVKDTHGRYVMANAACARMFGLSPEEIAGTDDSAWFPAAEARCVREVDRAVMRTGLPHTVEDSLTLAGATHVFHTTKAPHRDHTGRVVGVIGISRDITERKSEEIVRAWLAAIVESSADAVVGKTLDGVITSWNAAAERMYGYGRDEAIGQSISIIVPPERRAELAELLGSVAYGERIEQHETVRRRKDGTLVDVALTLSSICDPTGAVIGVSSISRDIGDKKRFEADLRQSEERLRLAVSAADLGTWCWEPKRDELVWSSICKRMHGIGADEEISYARFLASLHPEDREATERAVARSVEEHSDYRIEHRVVWPDGTERWLSVLGRPSYDAAGQLDRMLGVTMDVTSLKQAEQRRAELMDRERAALAEAQAATRAKDEFLAVLSHELRTPLQAMLGWTQMLQAPGVDAGRVQKGLATIERNVRTQGRIIEDLLDVSRIVAGKLRLSKQRVDLAEVVLPALESARAEAGARSIQIDAALEPLGDAIYGDPDRLQQVISNLLTNAVKFTPSGGRVGVRLERAGLAAVILVEDSGCGISPEFLPHVFDRFRQAEGTISRAHGGLGLGLAIVRHLVELHGGTITADSPGKDQGATFRVLLPLVSAARRADAFERRKARRSGSKGPGALEGVRILVVDDEPDACELLETIFQESGADVRAVRSARAALRELESFRPHLLVSDIGMPGEDGYALLRHVRARESAEGGHVPAIALTAFASQADREQAFAAGFEAHLAKPVSLVDLASTAASLVGRAA